jgi:hypothetical protein
MSGSGSFVIASTTSTTQSLAFALRSRYTRSAGTRPSRSRAAGRSSKSIERSRSIAACTSASIPAIASEVTEAGNSASVCRRMSMALITWIGSSWMSAAIR